MQVYNARTCAPDLRNDSFDVVANEKQQVWAVDEKATLKKRKPEKEIFSNTVKLIKKS